jgi:hypothetical protein
LDDLFGRVLVGGFTAKGDPDVVHDHPGTFISQAQGDGTADAATCAGHHCNSFIKQAHPATLCEACVP